MGIARSSCGFPGTAANVATELAVKVPLVRPSSTSGLASDKHSQHSWALQPWFL